MEYPPPVDLVSLFFPFEKTFFLMLTGLGRGRQKTSRRILPPAARLCLTLSLMIVEARAVEASGTYGDDVMWSLSSSGEFRIYGDGEIANYSAEADVPWSKYRARISTVIQSLRSYKSRTEAEDFIERL